MRTMDHLQQVLSREYNNSWDMLPDRFVIGAVYLWGRVIEHEIGYRAQFAYPKEIWALKPEHEQLGRIYNVPVRQA